MIYKKIKINKKINKRINTQFANHSLNFICVNLISVCKCHKYSVYNVIKRILLYFINHKLCSIVVITTTITPITTTITTTTPTTTKTTIQ
jgi:hypothetical protein